ncbi:MAG TPA: SDR family oxidoreductase [Nannocystis exedens]|nr:SDR family oxidoreductase [Nannocystis exedens]
MQIDAQDPPQAPIALVTGGAIRVGAAIVRSLAKAGYRVWIHYNRSQAAASALQCSLGKSAVGIVAADLSLKNARQGLVAKILDPAGPAAGHLDLLVNSAASFESGPFLQRSDEDLLRVLNLNLVAPLSLARSLAPMLASRGGSIINILDLAASQSWRGYTDHCIAKAGLAMATQSLALELAPELRVNGIAPGTVLWPEERRFSNDGARAKIVAGIPLGRIGGADDVARAVLYLAREPFITGHTIVIDGGRKVGRGSTP